MSLTKWPALSQITCHSTPHSSPTKVHTELFSGSSPSTYSGPNDVQLMGWTSTDSKLGAASCTLTLRPELLLQISQCAKSKHEEHHNDPHVSHTTYNVLIIAGLTLRDLVTNTGLTPKPQIVNAANSS